MSHVVRSWISWAAMALLASFVVTSSGCSAASEDDPDSEELVGADEDVETSEQGVSGSIAVGTKLVATTNVNLRTGASTSYKILHVVPNGAQVVVQASAPSNGFYKVKHDGTIGWTSGQYYKLASSGGTTTVHDKAIARAKSGKGFSYWWGHGRFRAEGPTSSTKGSCSGSCPSCSHSGSYGGDCSGYAAKVWQVPASNDTLSDDSHPYGTIHFKVDSSLWKTVSRANLKKADAMVYNTNGAGHIFIYESGDGWGSMYAYECKGCSYGCVAGLRTASSAYHGIRRAGY
jgi:hypothetical protein